MLAWLAACRSAGVAAPTLPVAGQITLIPPAPATVAATPAATLLPPTGTPMETPSTPTPSPTPDPYAGWTIEELAAREFGGPGVVLGERVLGDARFTQYKMHYESDGLTITGLANIPAGEGPFPVIVVNHGYGSPAVYYPGYDSAAIGNTLAVYGYIALMPDYRGYGGSDKGPNPFRIGYAVDVMNLVAQAGSLPQAAEGQIGVIGHSMGGGVSLWPMVLQDEVDAVVLYAAMSGDIAESWRYIRLMWDPEAMQEEVAALGTPDENPAWYVAASPTEHLDRVSMPVMIHHGTDDRQVPFEWSAELAEALAAAGKDVTFHAYEGAAHSFAGETFRQFISRSIAFFDQYVRGASSTSP